MRIFLLVLFISIQLKAQFIPLANIDSLKSHITFLGNDKLRGRGTGTPGLQQAALYISDKLESFGLSPKGQNNSWFQKVPMHGTKVLPSSSLQINYQNSNQYLFYKRDFLIIKSGGEAYHPGLLPVVFVGFGINAPEFEYNDYESVDVTGKIVIFFDGEPVSEDPSFFEGKEKSIYAFPEAKIRTAIAHGALGSIIIYDPTKSETTTWDKKRREYSFEEVTLPGRVTGHAALYLKPDKANILFQGAPTSYSELLLQKNHKRFSSFDLITKVAFNGDFKQREFKSDNIISILEGRDPLLKNKYLLIGAHYDHLGVGEQIDGDSVYNGVMDNAVGCAVTMELARMFMQAEFKPKKSIIFAFFSGEEKGLLGSDYYASHPQIDLKNTTAMINIDGLSALGKFQSLIAVGGQYSDLGNYLKNVAGEFGFEIEKINPSAFDLPFSKSDQLSFALAGVPSIQVLEGFSYPNLSKADVIKKTQHWFETYYHSPYDDLNQNIDYQSIKRYTNLMFIFINHLLNQQEDPKWLPDSPYQRKEDGQ